MRVVVGVGSSKVCFCGVAFECLDDAAEIVRAADEVDVVVEDCVGVEAESFVLAAVGEGVGDDFDVRGTREHREPFDDGRGDEVDAFGVNNTVT